MPVYKLRNANDFADAVEKNNKIVIDWYAQWCPPCKYIEPKLEILSNKYTKWTFISIDVDQFEKLAAKFNIKTMPTFMFIVNDKIEQFSGADIHKIEEYLNKL